MDLIAELERLRAESCDPHTVLILSFTIAELLGKECEKEVMAARSCCSTGTTTNS